MILGDINSKSPLWHCPETDEKGEKYEDIINLYHLVVQNKADQQPTFQGRAGVAINIDVTLTRGNLNTYINGWQVMEDVTTSQHSVIGFNIDLANKDDKQFNE